MNGGEQMSCRSVPHLLFNIDLLALKFTGFIHKSRKHQSMESITRHSVSSDDPRERPQDKDLQASPLFHNIQRFKEAFEKNHVSVL